MFNGHEAPMRILDQPMLGDPLMVMEQPSDITTPEGKRLLQIEAELSRQAYRCATLELRVAALEAQTPRAYWRRFVDWLRSCWPWR